MTHDSTHESHGKLQTEAHYEQLDRILDAGDMPSGQQIVEAVLHDHVLAHVWHRAIDFALYRIAQGQTPNRAALDDRGSIEIQAAYAALPVFTREHILTSDETIRLRTRR